ncbi:DUF151 domain-containing protein [Atopobium sp. oral taxon 416]|nr:DUF151 domain-containing protein [Atopobium sp. oral taxon 416]QUC03679.1 bifunctional nuclease family protein [Atopobium sp. oral taxon 416]
MDRSMTHNLLINVIESLGAQLDSVIISAVSGKKRLTCVNISDGGLAF